MRKCSSILLVVSLLVAACPLMATAGADALGTCMVDSLSGKERKQLAKWIYFAIAAHPEMATYANVTPDDRTKIDRYVGGLITRLLTETCAEQLRIGAAKDPLVLQTAFALVGQVAMQELMTDQNVQKSIASYAYFVDQKAIGALLEKK